MKTKRKCVLDNKVYIFIRDNAKLPIWHYYFTHNGDQFRGSTGHRDVGDATVAAISRYKAVRDGEVLVQTTRTSFKDVAERWLKVSETNRDIANKRKAVEKFFIPYFHDVLKLGLSRAVLKFARQASRSEQATRPWRAVQDRG
ncbi:MAG: hypothetical protein WCQ21_17590 [Verrucomicrobiota bacterium]